MSVLIRHHEHPFKGCLPRVIQAACVGEWLLAHFGELPQVGVHVYRGEPSGATEVTQDVEVLMEEEGEFTVLQSPGGEYALAFQIVMAVISVASALLASKPEMPSNVNRTSASNNNNFGARSNELRLMQRVEDIFGQVPAVPSLMGEPYTKYIGHQKVEVGYYCVSRGYCDLTRLRDGDTLISSISRASAAVYWPFTSPNSGHAPVLRIGEPIIDRIIKVKRSQEVDGITLKAQNQIELADGAAYSFEANPAGDRISQFEKRPNFNAVLNPGDDITIAMDDIAITASASVKVEAGASGFFGNFAPDDGGGGGGGSGGSGGEGEGGGNGE
ncbi:hypothetical protein GN316_15310 [Xylophilus sp. Kf1]|nr:hypothetical protein [Xylophilus sp. Kf1]